MLEPSFLKCYDFKHEGIWEVCLSGTQLDHSVQNISHSNLLLIRGQKLHKSGSVLLENTHEIKVLHSPCLTWESLLFSPWVVPSHLEIKETGYIKPSWKSEAFTEFILLIKLRFLADQGQMTKFSKIFPLISRFLTSKTSQRDLAEGCQAPPLPTMWGSWGKNFQGSASELCEHLQWLALPRPDWAWCFLGENKWLRRCGFGAWGQPLTHMAWPPYLTSVFMSFHVK